MYIAQLVTKGATPRIAVKSSYIYKDNIMDKSVSVTCLTDDKIVIKLFVVKQKLVVLTEACSILYISHES